MDEIIQTLQMFLPVIGQMTHHAQAAQLASQLVAIGGEEVSRRMAEKGQTRDEVLADAAATWGRAIEGADELRRLGHEGGEDRGGGS
jgi:hypothetical protein